MGTPLLDDEAIEAFFLGTSQSAWEQDLALLALAEEVSVATGGPPPRPHGALLAFLEDDATSATSTAPTLVAVPTLSPAATTPWRDPAGAPAAGPAHRRPDRRILTRRLRLSAGVAATIGIAAAALTVAGTTDVLPDPATRAIVRVVEAVTPFELSEPGNGPPSTVPAQQPGTTSTVPATAGSGSDAVGPSGPPAPTDPPPVITARAGPPGAAPPTDQAPPQPGISGLDRAGQTPAGPFIPPFAGPPPTSGGDTSNPPAAGVDRARETPAGTVIPPFAAGPPVRR